MTDQATEPGQEQTAEPQAEKSLDELLSEFDQQQGTEPTPQQTTAQQPQPSVSAERLNAVFQHVEQDMADKALQQRDDGIKSSVATMKEVEALKDVPDEVVRAHLIATAFDTPGFDQAFEQRASNPAAYSAVLKQAASSLAGTLKPQVDPQITADMQAARESIQGQSTTMPEQPDGPTQAEKNAMSRQEWDAHFQSLIKG